MRGGSDSVVWPATAEVAIVTHAANPATANCGLARLDTLTLVTLLALLASEASHAPTEGLAGWTVKLMDQLGLAGAAIAVSLDNFFPPIPSEIIPVSYTHLRAHETDSYLVCRLLLEK